jgi:hypothetical protein
VKVFVDSRMEIEEIQRQFHENSFG